MGDLDQPLARHHLHHLARQAAASEVVEARPADAPVAAYPASDGRQPQLGLHVGFVGVHDLELRL
ncbi:MAG: hypothetical protein M3O70_05890 [Actinomycetota bacterium]|nr:hypothetical protein [Actinomycetota bacterium]